MGREASTQKATINACSSHVVHESPESNLASDANVLQSPRFARALIEEY